MPSQINVNENLDDEDPKRNSKHPKRPSLTLTEEQDRALKLARVDDDVDTTTRIRAMIELWQKDVTIRKKVDKLAKQRSTELVRHRPRKR